MTFEQMLRRAKGGDQEAITSGRLDEDLYQELCITLMRAIDLFRI